MMGESAQLNLESAKTALQDILDTLDEQENAQKLSEAKTNAGNDMLKMMQYVFPMVVQIEMEVIKKYGFPDNRDGIIQFTQHIVTMEREDGEIAELHKKVRAHFLPPVTIASDATP
ncbi:protein C10 [Macrosteles quadrilineatus]|uniref:protein C10 n=1 Tax=Macrosteles quadrilineatus TaxID=74068 RepID=UPI0023E26208|nr:protein C10 [Macrosteles quadrilineatus]